MNYPFRIGLAPGLLKKPGELRGVQVVRSISRATFGARNLPIAQERGDHAGKVPAGCLISFLDSFPLGICCTNMEGEILLWNRIAEEITGFTKEEALGANCEDLLKHRDAVGKPLCHHGCPVEKWLKSEDRTPAAAGYESSNETGVMFGFFSGKLKKSIPIAWNVMLVTGEREGAIFHIFEEVASQVPVQEQSSRVRTSILSILSQLIASSYKLTLSSKRGRGKIILEADVTHRRGEGGLLLFLPPAPRFSSLTAREQEIVRCFRRGLGHQEVRQLLGIGSSTLKSHLRRIYKKLGIRSRAQLLLTSRAD